MKTLSKRLAAIKALVPSGTRACDVGTDHGYLPIELIKSGKCKSVIAVDINPSPLKNAKRNIEKSNVDGIELRLSDGLSKISPDEVDVVIIAGIGGEVIAGIIERGAKVLKQQKVYSVIQPTTSPEYLRGYLYENGYEIVKDIPILENGKLYSVMLVMYTGNISEFKEFRKYIGFVDYNSPYGKMYIEKQYNRLKKCRDALKDIPEKAEDYRYYSSLCEDIKKNITPNF